MKLLTFRSYRWKRSNESYLKMQYVRMNKICYYISDTLYICKEISIDICVKISMAIYGEI